MIPTKHVLIRLKQRGISRRAMELTITHGKSGRRPGKVVEYTLSKKEANFLKSDYGDEKKALEQATKIAVRVSEENDTVITAFHRK
jgi:hypothetical protein